MKDSNTLKELHKKIELGLTLSFEKLIAKKKKENGVLAFSKHGKILKINANDFRR